VYLARFLQQREGKGSGERPRTNSRMRGCKLAPPSLASAMKRKAAGVAPDPSAKAAKLVESALPWAQRKVGHEEPLPAKAACAATATPALAPPPERPPPPALSEEPLPCTPPLAPVFAAARLPFPAPASAPADCTSAELVCGHLGEQYCVKASRHGRGLFLTQGVKAGGFIARYSGVTRTIRTLPDVALLPRTHMMRVRGSHDIIDGRPLSDRLSKRSSGIWLPVDPAELRQGYAALANASATEADANAKMVFLPDDSLAGVRPDGYDAAVAPLKLKRDLVNLLPRSAFLVAKRDIAAFEEVKWHYQWSKE